MQQTTDDQTTDPELQANARYAILARAIADTLNAGGDEAGSDVRRLINQARVLRDAELGHRRGKAPVLSADALPVKSHR